MYEFCTGFPGKPTVEDRIIILDRLSTVTNVIQFRVFCYEFHLVYVGSLGNEAQSTALIISECAESPNFIKMSYKKPFSKRLITISPDTVYLKIMTYTVLLPKDAVSWPFVLP